MVQPGAGWHGWKADECQVASHWQMLSGHGPAGYQRFAEARGAQHGIFFSQIGLQSPWNARNYLSKLQQLSELTEVLQFPALAHRRTSEKSDWVEIVRSYRRLNSLWALGS